MHSRVVIAWLAGAFFVSRGMVFAGELTQTDIKDDAEFSSTPLPAFDLKSVTFESFAENHLLVTYEGFGPMSDLGKIYSWFAVWIDLDNSSVTGEVYGDFGADLILGTESNYGDEWTGEANQRDPVGTEAPITFIKAWTEGNRAFSLYQSPLFSKYPTFRAIAFSHHKGEFVDRIEGGSLRSITLFNRPEYLKPPPDFNDYSSNGEGELRTWNDRTGSFSIEASLKEARRKEVVLLLPGGETRTVEVSRLSAEDKDYLLKKKEDPPEREIAKAAPPLDHSPDPVLKEETIVKPKQEASEGRSENFWEGISKYLFSERAFGSNQLFGKMIRTVATMIPESSKPAWAFPVVFCGGLAIGSIGGLWFLVGILSASRWKGLFLLLLGIGTVIGSFVLVQQSVIPVPSKTIGFESAFADLDSVPYRCSP